MCGNILSNNTFTADDSWFAWPWSMYSSGDDEDIITIPTQIKSLKHRIGKENVPIIFKITIGFTIVAFYRNVFK